MYIYIYIFVHTYAQGIIKYALYTRNVYTYIYIYI